MHEHNQDVIESKPEINNVIVVEQLPVIRERLERMRASAESDVAAALALPVTEETVKEAKAVRANLKRDYEELERARIEAKKKILAPYEHFEGIYKECIADVYESADKQLKAKIDKVEDGVKALKKAEILGYFAEYCQSQGIEFLSFEQTGIKIDLSSSKKSLKAKAKAFADKVAKEVEYISEQSSAAEVLVEYRKTLDVVQSMSVVEKRHKALEAEIERIEKARALNAAQTKIVWNVEQAVLQEASVAIPDPLPVPVPLPTKESGEERVLTAKFTVRGTKSKLLELKRFLVDGGYDFK